MKAMEFLKNVLFGNYKTERFVSNVARPALISSVKKAIECVTGKRFAVSTTDETETELTILNNDLSIKEPTSGTRFIIPDNSTVAFDGMVVARQTAGDEGTAGDSASFTFSGLIKKVSSTVSIVGSVDIAELKDAAAANWEISVEADDTNDALIINVTGEADKTISWTGHIRYQIAE